MNTILTIAGSLALGGIFALILWWERKCEDSETGTFGELANVTPPKRHCYGCGSLACECYDVGGEG